MSNLADKFTPAAKTPDRSAGLAGLLPASRRPVSPASTPPGQQRPTPAVPDLSVATAPQTVTNRAVAEPEAAEATPTGVSEPNPADTAQSHATGGAEIVRIPVYVDTELRKLLREAKQRPGTPTYGAVAVEAFARHNTDSLKALFEQPEPVTAGAGIPRPAAPVGPPKGGSEIQLHLRADQVAWIEDQQRRCAVGSRSHFIATVLAADLRSKK